MKILPFLICFTLFLSSCDESGSGEIYNENNTNVSGGIVYNIEDEPINGLYRVYYPDGNIKMEVQSKGGKPNGAGKFYTPEGNLSFQGNFADGHPEGAFFNYYPDGLVHNEMNYNDGVKNGPQKVYDEEGNLSAEVVFEKGVPVSGYVLIKGEKQNFTEDELGNLK